MVTLLRFSWIAHSDWNCQRRGGREREKEQPQNFLKLLSVVQENMEQSASYLLRPRAAMVATNFFHSVISRSQSTRGGTICFNSDAMCMMIHGWRYNTRMIWAHLQQYDIIWYSSMTGNRYCNPFFAKNRGKENA